jgi:threonine dehydrogenase-like Zn-dependent dehydrogenase
MTESATNSPTTMAQMKTGKMKAVRWEGKPFSVSVKEIDIPKITQPLDAIVRLTSSAICGSDLHTYHGRIGMNHPLTFGHENIGIIEEIGKDITSLKKGDRVIVAAVLEESTDDGELQPVESLGVGKYGSGVFDIPQINGGQAGFLRVPFANVNLFVVPPGNEHELDYLLLADIWPTAWWALDCAGQVLGDTVVVFGAGITP